MTVLAVRYLASQPEQVQLYIYICLEFNLVFDYFFAILNTS